MEHSYKPVLSIRVDELPQTPKLLEGIELLNVFIADKHNPFGDEEAVIIRAYNSLDDLIPLEQKNTNTLDFYKIKWVEKTDYPDWLNLQHQLGGNEVEFPLHIKDIDTVFNNYPNLSGIKIGGWPTQIQVSAVYFIVEGDPGYIMQIDETEIYSFLDAGIGYLLWSEKYGFHTDGWTTY